MALVLSVIIVSVSALVIRPASAQGRRAGRLMHDRAYYHTPRARHAT